MTDLPNPELPVDQIKFHQIKSNFFRVVHADGMWCSVHPSDLLHLTFYNERAPLATEVTHDLYAKGKLGPEDFTKRKSKAGYIREMEVDVVLSRTAAASLHQYLDQYLKGTLQLPAHPHT